MWKWESSFVFVLRVVERVFYLFCLCVVWPPCLAILCYMGGDVGHVVYMCEGGGGGSISLGEVSWWGIQRIQVHVV